MKKRIRSLSDQLNELNEVAPAGPESDEDAYDANREEIKGASDEDEEEQARFHARINYFTPSSSTLRKQADFLEGASAEQRQKYQGVKTTRKELLGDEEVSEDNGSEDEEGMSDLGFERSDQSKSSTPTHSRIKSKISMQANGNGQTNKKRKSVHFDAEQDAANESNEARGYNAAQKDADMIQSLQIRSQEDAAKGRDIRKQKATWRKLLGLRIQAQKVIRAGGRIPSRLTKEDDSVDMEQEDRKILDTTLNSLSQISRHLFNLQTQILSSFAKAETSESSIVSAALPAISPLLDEIICSPKHISEEGSDHDRQLEAIIQLDQNIFEPLWRDILARWSNRTSKSLSEGINSNKFHVSLKAMNQSAEDQIDRGLSGDAFERLRKRTRVWRGSEQESRIYIPDAAANEDDSEGEEKFSEDADIFDDSDFYSALLRELIESKGSSSDMGGGVDVPDSSSIWAQAAKSAAKKNKNGEMKVSKGRRIRYDVIEKVEHFMPLVPREIWSNEQIERLFRQVSGAIRKTKEVNGGGNQITVIDIGESEGDLGGLRLFG